jgi:hypothetical protein
MKPEPAQRLTKYTERELKDRHIATFIDPQGQEVARAKMKIKRETYAAEGVLQSYKSLFKCFTVLLDIQEAVGFTDTDQYHQSRCAQVMMDSCLLKRSRGEKCDVPSEVHLYEKKQEEAAKGIALYEADEATDKPACSENEKVRWLFENMQTAGVEVDDAPSVGTYTLLMEMRENQQMRTHFYQSSWLKLLAKEDAEKTGKLQDTGKETRELIERLQAAMTEVE